VLCATQPPLQPAPFGDKVDQAAWESRPTWYLVSAQDRIVSVALERELAAAMGARTIELPAGHLSLLSQPESGGVRHSRRCPERCRKRVMQPA
jgi:pimeloyl-ACP methyl ester carboxylesterase